MAAPPYSVDEKSAAKDQVEVSVPASLNDEKLESNDGVDPNTIIEGSEGVTQHEFDTLRHVADKLPYSAWLVLIAEFAER